MRLMNEPALDALAKLAVRVLSRAEERHAEAVRHRQAPQRGATAEQVTPTQPTCFTGDRAPAI